MDWILLIGSVSSAWVILSVLANERQSRVLQRDQQARQAAAMAAKKAMEIPVMREVRSSR
jgi:hypothetical protein